MSLDISLKGKEIDCPDCRKCWNCDDTGKLREALYGANVTHNLRKMADAAGLYTVLWRPEELNITKAKDLIPLLDLGIQELKRDPKHYRTFDAPNGWGTYESFIPWLEDYLKACKANPEAEVRVSR